MNYKDVVAELRRIGDEFFSTRGAVFMQAIQAITDSLKAGHKILVFGNGGSAAEAQHFASEMVNKFLINRPPLKAIALTTDTSILTSIGNDTSFDSIFSRQVEALGESGDVALALTTSGNSPNVIQALQSAKQKKMTTITLTGKGGGKAAPLSDYLLDLPSGETPRIQEVHLLLIHLIVQEIEIRLENP
ncbi:MAG: SIS domain-containing protein [Candidatus Aminicenantales bacterium]